MDAWRTRDVESLEALPSRGRSYERQLLDWRIRDVVVVSREDVPARRHETTCAANPSNTVLPVEMHFSTTLALSTLTSRLTCSSSSVRRRGRRVDDFQNAS